MPVDTVKMQPIMTRIFRALMRHLQDYTAKNNFDYFIHKDLGGFLRRELDFYIKNGNVLGRRIPTILWKHLAQVKAIKQVGEKIITFLARLGFKRNSGKKKFVVDLIIASRSTEFLMPFAKLHGVMHSAKKWVRLFALSMKSKATMMIEGYSEPLTEKFAMITFLVNVQVLLCRVQAWLVESMENVDEGMQWSTD